jgi:hypothetical protein
MFYPLEKLHNFDRDEKMNMSLEYVEHYKNRSWHVWWYYCPTRPLDFAIL